VFGRLFTEVPVIISVIISVIITYQPVVDLLKSGKCSTRLVLGFQILITDPDDLTIDQGGHQSPNMFMILLKVKETEKPKFETIVF
jgi:hypothetical protein